MWRQGEVPQDFKDATIVHLYRRKGNRQICDNHRGISLLNIAGKIFARILLNRLNNHLEQGLLPERQCGFRPHRGTTDMIFAACQLQKCQEMRTHLYSTFMDLTKAFDTMNREGLWKIMQKFGCLERFTQMPQGRTATSSISVGRTFSRVYPQPPSTNFCSLMTAPSMQLLNETCKGACISSLPPATTSAWSSTQRRRWSSIMDGVHEAGTEIQPLPFQLPSSDTETEVAGPDPRHGRAGADGNPRHLRYAETTTTTLERPHLARMDDERLPKRLFYGDVSTGSRQKGQIRRYKDTLKTSLKCRQINPANWEDLVRDRPTWRTVKTGAAIFEAKRKTLKSQLPSSPPHNANAQPPPTPMSSISLSIIITGTA
ncbi:hypothetical protein SprV_0401561500 [Sparganum proliferum]